MTYETKLGDVKLVINYEHAHGDLELGTILMEKDGKYTDVTDLLNEVLGFGSLACKYNPFDKWESEIRESLNEKPSYLNED